MVVVVNTLTIKNTKRCSNCGYIKEDLTLSDREWTCPECHV